MYKIVYRGDDYAGIPQESVVPAGWTLLAGGFETKAEAQRFLSDEIDRIPEGYGLPRRTDMYDAHGQLRRNPMARKKARRKPARRARKTRKKGKWSRVTTVTKTVKMTRRNPGYYGNRCRTRKTRRLRSVRNNPGLPRESLLALRDDLEAKMRAISDTLKTYPRGPSGLAPDHIRSLPAYRALKADYQHSFDALRRVNKALRKTR